MKSYDYIIAGAGCAGLMLAMEITNSPLKEKSILIIDKDLKSKNDRTWCFWEIGKNPLEKIVFRTWDVAKFYGTDFEAKMKISPYQYKMIRGIDFYDHSKKTISRNPNIQWLNEHIDHIDDNGFVIANKKKYYAEIIFNSFQSIKELDIPQKKYFMLLQHFKGWSIKTSTPIFKTNEMTYMDFRVDQKNDTRFCYVLPYSTNEALVEYTLFSDKLLKQDEYDNVLKQYINENLGVESYDIKEEEFGIIPMTDFPFPKKSGDKIFNIGTLGGQTKASTGYTFLRIQKNIKNLVKNLIKTGKPICKSSFLKKRFQLYDSTMLNVLANNRYSAKDFFSEIFQKNGPLKVFKFLDEETKLSEELTIMNLKPKRIFIKAFFQQLFKIRKL